MTQKARSKGFSLLAVIVVVLVIAAVGVGGWVVWDRNHLEQTADGVSKPENDNDDGGQSNRKTIPNDFTLYSNEEIGFSFAYPKPVGELSPYTYQQNPSPLLSVKSQNTQNLFADYTQAPLFVVARELEGFRASAGKYGPVIEFINNRWVVSDKDGGDVNNAGYALGSEYKASIARTVEGVPVYDLSYSDEGCYTTVWVFKTVKAFVSIKLPSVCADDIDAIPQERLDNYKITSNKVLETLTLK